MNKEAILKWISENRFEMFESGRSKGMVYTDRLLSFLNSLPDDNEIAKQKIQEWLENLPSKEWKSMAKHSGVLISESLAKTVVNEIIYWLDHRED